MRERASRQMVPSGPKTQRVKQHRVCLGAQAGIGECWERRLERDFGFRDFGGLTE